LSRKVEGIDPAGRMTGEERRTQLVETAIRLFSQKGFRGTTTKEIALASGINEAIIFRHFTTKDDLYAAILDRKAGEVNVKEWLDEMSSYAESRDDEKLFRSLATKLLERHRRDRDFMRLMLYSALEGHELRERQVRPIHEFLRDYIVKRQGEGAFRKCNPNAAVRAFIGMFIFQSLVTGLLGSDLLKVTDKDAVDNFIWLFLDGLRSPAAPKRPAKRTPSKKE
jgi:TetR/AcrR family transcriptional regulator